MPDRDKVLRVAIREAQEQSAVMLVFYDTSSKDWRFVEYKDATHRKYAAEYAQEGTTCYVLPFGEVVKLS